jgi:hypothetical protein
MVIRWDSWYVITGSIISASSILGYLLRKVYIVVSTWAEFIRDWKGEEATNGRDAVPGVMARLNEMDGELKHNGGSSLKDRVFLTDEKVDRLEEKVDRLETKLDAAEASRQENQNIIMSAIAALSTKNPQN